MTLPAGFAAATADALPLSVVAAGGFAAWRTAQPAAVQAWADAHGFDGRAGVLLLPGADGAPAAALLGVGSDRLDPYSYAHAPSLLPARGFRLSHALPAEELACLQLGWGLGSFRDTRWRDAARAPAELVVDALADAVAEQLAACLCVRRLVNTPTEELGPEQFEAEARALAEQHGATCTSVIGEALLAQNFPAIHAVGRASHRAPRLVEMHWGDPAHLPVTLVGKGVCFDTGGLDLKNASGMRHMKKDMGGAAHALALAGLLMATRVPVRLTVLLPLVENAVGPNAYRPGEILRTRTGLRVEIENTDAEGRLVLGDALAYACEGKPALLLDFATLTGAARIALGPDLPALFSNDDALANDWLAAAASTRDPLWRMPLWQPYLRYLDSRIATLSNSGSTPMAGCISAALYLQRFVAEGQAWAHLDTYSWNDSDRPGRPTGGEAQGLRSAYAMIRARAGG
jgi:leucyl aminopeptidase